MRTVITCALFLALCFAPASAGENKCSAYPEATPLCSVLSDASKYDGKEITVRGLYRMVIHGSILMSPACSETNVNMRRLVDEKPNKQALAVIRSLTKKDQFRPVDVVLRGNFRVAHDGCFGQNCLHYEIEETELLCAAPTKSSSSSGAADPKSGVSPTPTTH
jgi:hypothetical protein